MSLLSQISIRKLANSYLEKLRQWRNDPNVNRYLLSKEYISKQKQEEWFSNLNNQTEQYFIVFYKDEPIGCASLRNVREDLSKAEPGFFIGERRWQNTPLASLCLIKFLDFVFYGQYFKVLEAWVYKENLSAIQMYQQLGFTIHESCYPDFLLTTCHHSQYVSARKNFDVS